MRKREFQFINFMAWWYVIFTESHCLMNLWISAGKINSKLLSSLQLGSHENWVHLVMACVTSVTYSTLVNGSPTNVISPSRGLRQSDPCHLIYFIMCRRSLSHARESYSR